MAKVELEGKLTSKRPCDSGSRARRRLVLQSQLPGTGWISQRIANIQLRTWCLHVIEACQASGSKSPVYWMCDCSTRNLAGNPG